MLYPGSTPALLHSESGKHSKKKKQDILLRSVRPKSVSPFSFFLEEEAHSQDDEREDNEEEEENEEEDQNEKKDGGDNENDNEEEGEDEDSDGSERDDPGFKIGLQELQAMRSLLLGQPAPGKGKGKGKAKKGGGGAGGGRGKGKGSKEAKGSKDEPVPAPDLESLLRGDLDQLLEQRLRQGDPDPAPPEPEPPVPPEPPGSDPPGGDGGPGPGGGPATTTTTTTITTILRPLLTDAEREALGPPPPGHCWGPSGGLVVLRPPSPKPAPPPPPKPAPPPGPAAAPTPLQLLNNLAQPGPASAASLQPKYCSADPRISGWISPNVVVHRAAFFNGAVQPACPRQLRRHVVSYFNFPEGRMYRRCTAEECFGNTGGL